MAYIRYLGCKIYLMRDLYTYMAFKSKLTLIDLNTLMTEPENIKNLKNTSSDTSQIFSVSSYHQNRRNFVKDLYEIRTVDAAEIDSDLKHTPSTSFIQMYFPFSKNEELASNFVSVDKVNIRFGLILTEMDALGKLHF